MKDQKLAAINELTSPLFRIMSIQNPTEVHRRQFDNNIVAFHIGDGFILTVAHNLRMESGFFKSIDDLLYKSLVAPQLNSNEIQLFEQGYVFDKSTNKWYLNMAFQNNFPALIDVLKRINFDTRWVNLYQKQICNPYLLIQQRINTFYNNAKVHSDFNSSMIFMDPKAQRQTYLIETELVEAFYQDDIALYRIINTPASIVQLLPYFEIDSEIYDVSNNDYFCVQSAPSDLNPGRMINSANIEGFVDQYSGFNDRIGGNYNLEGLRYLIKGYFRFGSSGAPYIKFDEKTKSFKVNAVQSEACPIQLTIKNDRNGNFQYINAIATPLANVVGRIKAHKAAL